MDDKSLDKFYRNMKIKEKIAKYFFSLMSITSIFLICLICIFLFREGFLFFKEYNFIDFIFSNNWHPTASPRSYGIFSMIITSLITTLLSVVIALPIGLFTAIFLSYYCSKKIYGSLKSLINLMASIPSIIYGFFALIVLVPLVRNTFKGTGMSIFTASILLSMMILPTIISISENSINLVDKKYFLASIALGATKEESIIKVVLRVCKSGIISSVVLAIGRSVGETMAVYMVIGNQARFPKSLFDGARSLTTNIVLEMGYADSNHTSALISTACVLFVFVLIINLIFFYIRRKEH